MPSPEPVVIRYSIPYHGRDGGGGSGRQSRPHDTMVAGRENEYVYARTVQGLRPAAQEERDSIDPLACVPT